MNKEKYLKSSYAKDLESTFRALQSLRKDQQNPQDIDLQDFIKVKYGVSMETFLDDLGLNSSIDSIQAMVNMPDSNIRWLIPELIRDALKLGLRKAPIYPDLIASEQTISQPQVTIPHINMSDAMPRYVGTAETIPDGTISYGSKSLRVRKMGRGIKIPYEVMQYVSLNVIALFLQDFGIKLNHGLDSLAIDVLINGEQADGSESAPVIGINTPGTFVYRDLLRIWIRMSRIGRTATTIVGGEDAALDTLDLPEFKLKQQGTPQAQLNLKTPVPQSVNYYIHGGVPDDQQILVDATSAMIKYNAQPLLIEEDKIVSKQVLETYASLTTGFGILYRDARIVIDSSLDFDVAGFPSYMDVDPLEQVTIID